MNLVISSNILEKGSLNGLVLITSSIARLVKYPDFGILETFFIIYFAENNKKRQPRISCVGTVVIFDAVTIGGLLLCSVESSTKAEIEIKCHRPLQFSIYLIDTV